MANQKVSQTIKTTVGIDDVSKTDSTTLHLQNKMKQLGLKKVHILNLFSKIAKWKATCRRIKRGR